MRIVIDGRMINESGIGRYLRNLISEQQKLDQENEYFILLLRKDYNNLEIRGIATPASPVRNDGEGNFHKVLVDYRWYSITEQLRLPGILKSISPDLVHFPHFNVPIFYRGKFVVTIHDLIHQSFSMDRSTHTLVIYGLKHLGYKKIFGNAVKKAEKILVPSQYVKDQLIKKWKVDDRKIIVTYEGVDDKMLTTLTKMSTTLSQKILEKFGIKHQYIFYVGNAHPHKNVEGLIRAFLRMKDSGLRQNDIGKLQLVLSGQDNFFWQKIKKEFKHDDILYTGKVSDEELTVLYKNAKCFVMPSFEEGFGLPILEAFALGCPVVSSNAASLPEVGGNGAIYFDPKDTNDMIKKISMVLCDEKLSKDLIEKGRKRVKQFSWQKMAKQTLEVYNSL